MNVPGSERLATAGSIPVVTVDGPGGAGKGTVAVRLARVLGWHLLDSGALYRLVALAARQADVDWTDVPQLAALASDLAVEFRLPPGATLVETFLNGEPVRERLRSEEVGAAASIVATLPAVRAALLERQRTLVRWPGLVADGRDMGTVVFPEATLKVFLTASLEERARRRYEQLRTQGLDGTVASLRDELEARDRRDAERSVAPLRPATDAWVLDSTGVSIEAVVERILERLAPRLASLV
jgi:cytidylate kinase